VDNQFRDIQRNPKIPLDLGKQLCGNQGVPTKGKEVIPNANTRKLEYSLPDLREQLLGWSRRRRILSDLLPRLVDGMARSSAVS